MKKAFKAKVRQKLTERQRKARVDASKALLNKQRIPPHTWFTDESWFYSDGIVQRKNEYYWALSKDAVEPIEKQLTPIKVIGPYFFITMVLMWLLINTQECVPCFVEKLSQETFPIILYAHCYFDMKNDSGHFW